MEVLIRRTSGRQNVGSRNVFSQRLWPASSALATSELETPCWLMLKDPK